MKCRNCEHFNAYTGNYSNGEGLCRKYSIETRESMSEPCVSREPVAWETILLGVLSACIILLFIKGVF